MDDLVVTVTPTIMDGTVVRWHRSLIAAENHNPLISASRNGVSVHATYLTDVPDELIIKAREVYEQLRRNRSADMLPLATHRRRSLAGSLVPVEPGGSDG